MQFVDHLNPVWEWVPEEIVHVFCPRTGSNIQELEVPDPTETERLDNQISCQECDGETGEHSYLVLASIAADGIDGYPAEVSTENIQQTITSWWSWKVRRGFPEKGDWTLSKGGVERYSTVQFAREAKRIAEELDWNWKPFNPLLTEGVCPICNQSVTDDEINVHHLDYPDDRDIPADPETHSPVTWLCEDCHKLAHDNKRVRDSGSDWHQKLIANMAKHYGETLRKPVDLDICRYVIQTLNHDDEPGSGPNFTAKQAMEFHDDYHPSCQDSHQVQTVIEVFEEVNGALIQCEKCGIRREENQEKLPYWIVEKIEAGQEENDPTTEVRRDSGILGDDPRGWDEPTAEIWPPKNPDRPSSYDMRER